MNFYNLFQVQILSMSLATPVQDFGFVAGGNITIPGGVGTSAVPISVVADELPELNEHFIVVLRDVEVLGVTVDDFNDLPILGNITDTIVTIEENDDPYGRFVIYYGNQEQQASVPEPSIGSIAVILTVEREAGTIGDVQVSWSASGVNASSEDFTGK